MNHNVEQTQTQVNTSAADLKAAATKLRDEISRLMYERTKRSPMILPIFMEI